MTDITPTPQEADWIAGLLDDSMTPQEQDAMLVAVMETADAEHERLMERAYELWDRGGDNLYHAIDLEAEHNYSAADWVAALGHELGRAADWVAVAAKQYQAAAREAADELVARARAAEMREREELYRVGMGG